jgi:hypothetical protein
MMVEVSEVCSLDPFHVQENAEKSVNNFCNFA